jgi:hypothetical protein
MIRTAETLPAGDMPLPNKALQLEWFYMSFHSDNCVKYVESGQHLCDKTLKSVTEYFKNIYNLQVANSSLAKKRKRQIMYRAKRDLHHTLKKQY